MARVSPHKFIKEAQNFVMFCIFTLIFYVSHHLFVRNTWVCIAEIKWLPSGWNSRLLSNNLSFQLATVFDMKLWAVNQLTILHAQCSWVINGDKIFKLYVTWIRVNWKYQTFKKSSKPVSYPVWIWLKLFLIVKTTSVYLELRGQRQSAFTWILPGHFPNL